MTSKADSAHPTGAVIFFFAVFLASLFAFMYVLWDFVTDVVLGFLIAGICRPLYLRSLSVLRNKGWLAAGLVTSFVGILVAVPTVYLVTSLSQQAASAYVLIHGSLEGPMVQEALRGEGWFGSRAAAVFELFGMEYSADSIRSSATNMVRVVAAFLSTQLNAIISNVLAVFYHFAMMLVVVYYGLLDGPSFKRRLFDLSPLPDEEEELIVQKFKDVGIAILLGNGVASLLQGFLGGVAMWLAGLHSAVFWGAIIAIFAFLPLIGTNVVVVPATVYLIVDGRWVTAVVFFVLTNVQGVFIDNIVKTKLMGNRMQMHTLLMFLALVGGITAFGFAGLLYGPLIAALFVTVVELYESVYRVQVFARSRHGHESM